MIRLAGEIQKKYIISGYRPLRICTLKTCNKDISKTITARSFKLGQLMNNMIRLRGEKRLF